MIIKSGHPHTAELLLRLHFVLMCNYSAIGRCQYRLEDLFGLSRLGNEFKRHNYYTLSRSTCNNSNAEGRTPKEQQTFGSTCN